MGTKAQPAAKPVEHFRSHVDASGRVLIPAELRKRLRLHPGTVVSLAADTHSVNVLSQPEALRQAQEYFARLHRSGASIVDELVAERRAEAAREYGPPQYGPPTRAAKPRAQRRSRRLRSR